MTDQPCHTGREPYWQARFHPFYTNPLVNDMERGPIVIRNHYTLPGYVAVIRKECIPPEADYYDEPINIGLKQLEPTLPERRHSPRWEAHMGLRNLDDSQVGNLVARHLRDHLSPTHYWTAQNPLIPAYSARVGIRWAAYTGTLLYEGTPLWPACHRKAMGHIARHPYGWLVDEIVSIDMGKWRGALVSTIQAQSKHRNDNAHT